MSAPAVKDKKAELAELIAAGVKSALKESGVTDPVKGLPFDPKDADDPAPTEPKEALEYWRMRSEHAQPEYAKHVDEALGFKRLEDGKRIDAVSGQIVAAGVPVGRYVRAMAAMKRGILPEKLAKALTEGTNADGGFMVPPQYVAEMIPLLRAWAVVRAAGTRVIPLRKSLTQPKLTGGGTAAYIGENSPITVSQQVLGQFTLAVKKLAALVAISNDLIRDADPASDAMVRDDLVKVMGLKQDLQFIRGTGSATAPTGIRNQAGIQTLALGTNGATPTYDNLSDLLSLLETANVAFTAPAWLAHGRVLNTLRKIKDSQNRPILEPTPNNPQFRGSAGAAAGDVQSPARWSLLGYPLFISNQIPVNLTKGTSSDCSEIYFGDFDEAVIGENMELEIDISTEASFSDGGTNNISAFANDLTLVRAIERHDFGLRHAEGMCVITDARA